MDKLFLDAANKVLSMYDYRQECSPEFTQPHSTTEISWASEILYTLAGVAAYSGCSGSIAIRTAAQEWQRSGVRPAYFVVSQEGDKSC